MQCLIDCAAERGLLACALRCVHLLQQCVQGAWAHASPLLAQLPALTPFLVQLLPCAHIQTSAPLSLSFHVCAPAVLMCDHYIIPAVSATDANRSPSFLKPTRAILGFSALLSAGDFLSTNCDSYVSLLFTTCIFSTANYGYM